MIIRDVPAIDVHCHYGFYRTKEPSIWEEFQSADEQTVMRRLADSNIKCAVVSPLLGLSPRGDNDAVAGNIECREVCARNAPLFQWAVVDPRKPETFAQAEEMLKDRKCLGIKIHPEEHLYPIKEQGKKIFEWAARQGVIVQSHSGEERSNPLDYVEFANNYPNVKMILSHIGCGWDRDPTRQVRAIQAAKHGNIYSDTSSASSITPGLIEWAVREAGSEHIMFGTDTPCYFTAMQRARIDEAEMEEEHKLDILYRTALTVFGGALEEYYNEVL